jgi:Putative lipoprotein LpqV
LWFLVVVVAGSVGLPAVAGCSHDADGGKAPTSPAHPSPRPSGAPGAQAPVPVGVSAAGVTTRVDAPADSTEEQYYQACHAAKEWMDAQPNPPSRDSLFEPYLAMVQAAPSGTAGSWNMRWADMTPARQAAVIVAAQAAAKDECG